MHKWVDSSECWTCVRCGGWTYQLEIPKGDVSVSAYGEFPLWKPPITHPAFTCEEYLVYRIINA